MEIGIYAFHYRIEMICGHKLAFRLTHSNEENNMTFKPHMPKIYSEHQSRSCLFSIRSQGSRRLPSSNLNT